MLVDQLKNSEISRGRLEEISSSEPFICRQSTADNSARALKRKQQSRKAQHQKADAWHDTRMTARGFESNLAASTFGEFFLSPIA